MGAREMMNMRPVFALLLALAGLVASEGRAVGESWFAKAKGKAGAAKKTECDKNCKIVVKQQLAIAAGKMIKVAEARAKELKKPMVATKKKADAANKLLRRATA